MFAIAVFAYVGWMGCTSHQLPSQRANRPTGTSRPVRLVEYQPVQEPSTYG